MLPVSRLALQEVLPVTPPEKQPLAALRPAYS
jgi:hypothetical protein